MDIFAFLLSTTGILVVLALGLFLYFFMGKGTGANASKYKRWGKWTVGAAVLLWILPMLIVVSPTADTTGDSEIDTNYSIVWVLDSTTAVISSDFAQTDEPAAGEYALTTDANGNTVAVALTNTCDYSDNACTWDAFSFTNTITANFESQWVDGARVTSVLSASIDPDILSFGIRSNNTGGNPIVTLVDKSPLSVSGLVWVDGAGANKAVGATTGQLNEFSPGESVTSTGLYFAVNEDDLSRKVPAGIWSDSWNIVYSDDFGFSHTVVLTITLTTQA